MEAVTVDLDPLRRTPGIGDILAYERMTRIPWYRRYVVILVGILLAAGAVGSGLWWMNANAPSGAVPVIGLVCAAYGLLAAVGFVWYTVGLGRRVKIAGFARANDWAYADSLEHTGRSGSAFTRVARGRERAVVRGDDPRMPFELGMHHSVSRGDERATIQRPFGFIELPLPSSVPHIVLANRKRSIVPTLGLGRGAAKMDLEGEFAGTFRLIVPEGYQQDALYIFTPDLMARVIDLGAGTEIELVDAHVYVYLPARTRFDRPETMASALVLAEEFHRRFGDRTRHYRDESPVAQRAGVAVGLRGRRLHGRGISVFAVAVTAGIVLFSAAVSALTLFIRF